MGRPVGFGFRRRRNQRELSAVAVERMRGNPDPRGPLRQHQLGQHALVRQAVRVGIQNLNNLTDPDEIAAVQTRVEVVRRVPHWQERIINLQQRRGLNFLGAFVLGRFQNNFTLVRYAYGLESEERRPARYIVDEALNGYIVPSPVMIDRIPGAELPAGIQGRYQDLVLSAEDDSSWAGTIHAHHGDMNGDGYEHAVAVGPDVDVMGLGHDSDIALDMIAGTEPGNIIPRQIGHLIQVAQHLQNLGYQAEMGAYPPGAIVERA